MTISVYQTFEGSTFLAVRWACLTPTSVLSLRVFIFSDGFVISLGMRDSLSLLARRQG